MKAGDTVKAEDPLVTLESDKATMDVPSPVDGVVKDIKVKVGDKVSEGSRFSTSTPMPRRRRRATARRSRKAATPPPPVRPRRTTARRVCTSRSMCGSRTSATSRTCRSSKCFVKAGDTVKAEDALITLESDKATMDVPSPVGRHGGGAQGQGRRQGVRREPHPHAVDRRDWARPRQRRRSTAQRRKRQRLPRRPPPPRRTPAAPTSNAKCSCWARDPAAIRPRSARPISA